MLYGFKDWSGGQLKIRVEGFMAIRYIGYSEMEAVANYREKFGLKHKRIAWCS